MRENWRRRRLTLPHDIPHSAGGCCVGILVAMTLTLMCGLSFAGKSTLAAELAEGLGARLISLDMINEERGLHGGQGIPLEEWGRSDRIAHVRVEQLLGDGAHVVVDDTGSPQFIRDAWRKTAVEAGAPFVIVWVQIDPKLQGERVRVNREAERRPDVTDAVLREHAANFEPPTNEHPIVVDASQTRDPKRVKEIISEIRRLASDSSDDVR